ncbi:MAG: hypothetical protein C0418_03415 [Coriobacteriaceae bacterium]|nr:hypothetical protein [Coriobacteriaceae bacterium]
MPEDTSSPGSRFFGLPSTPLGRASAILLLTAVAFIVLASTVFATESPTVGKLNIVPAIIVLILFLTLVTGAAALIRGRERSWAVWLSTVLPAIVLGAEVLSMLIPGE